MTTTTSRRDSSHRGADRTDHGSDSVELALLPVVIMSVIALMMGFAHIGLTTQRINGAAYVAARAASIARSPGAAIADARDAAAAQLHKNGLDCTQLSVFTDTSGFNAVPGQPAFVHVNVRCTIALSDVTLGFIPGSRTLTDTAVSPVDPARDTS